MEIEKDFVNKSKNIKVVKFLEVSFVILALDLIARFSVLGTNLPAIFWPATGATVAYYVFYGSAAWSAIFTGYFLSFICLQAFQQVYWDFGHLAVIAILSSFILCLQGCGGAHLIRRYVNKDPLYDIYEILKFSLMALLVSFIAPVAGVFVFVYSGFYPDVFLEQNIFSRVFAHFLGILIITPVFLIWLREKSHSFFKSSLATVFYKVILISSLMLISLYLFKDWRAAFLAGLFIYSILSSVNYGQKTSLNFFAITALALIGFSFLGDDYLVVKGTKFSESTSLSVQASLFLITLTVAGLNSGLNAYRRAVNMAHVFKSRYRAILESQTELICRFTPDTKLTFVNDAYCQFFGKKREDLIGKSYLELVPHVEREQERRKLYNLLHDKPQIIRVHKVLMPDNEIGWQQWIDQVILDDKGKVVELQSVGRDITDLKKVEEELKKSEATSRVLIDSNIIGVCFWEIDGNVIDANENMLSLFGYNREELSSGKLKWTDIFPENHKTALGSIRRQLKLTRRFKPMELKLKKVDGSEFMAYFGGCLLPDSDSQGVCFVVDQSKRRSAERELRATTERFKFLVENSPSIIYSLKKIGKHSFQATYVSDNIKSFYGYEPKEFLNNSDFWKEHLHSDDVERVYSSIPTLIKDGRIVLEYRFLCSDGTYKWVRDEIKVIPATNGDDMELIGYCVDVTALKKEERKLREAYEETTYALGVEVEQKIYAQAMKDRLAAILEATTDFVMMVNFSGEVLYMNKAARQVIGVNEKGEVDKDDHYVFYPQWVQKMIREEAVPTAIKEGVWSGRSAILNSEGKEIPISQLLLAHKSKGGEVDFISTISRDITEAIKYETELVDLKERADSANRAKSNFLANMSHEIRTPLGVLLGYSELLVNPGLDPRIRKQYYDVIQRNGQNLLTLIDDILDLSKVESGYLEFDRSNFKLKDFIENLIAEYELKAYERNLKLTYRYEGAVPKIVKSDQMRLRQILTNIINNAIKFTDEGSVDIKIHFDQDGDNKANLIFDVTDSGCGIELENTEILFRPFTQADGSITRKYGGTGLGLSLSRHLARALGGDVQLLETHPGKGSVFRLQIDAGLAQTLRLIEIKEEHKTQREPKKRTILGKEKNKLRGVRVLIVEDFEDNQSLMRTVLENFGAQVKIASNGKLGLDEALANSYDVIFMDIQMPVMNGYEATKALRSSGYKGPVVALTAYAMEGEKKKCLSIGFTDYLSKPVEPNLLIKMAEKYGKGAVAERRKNVRIVKESDWEQLEVGVSDSKELEPLVSAFADDPVISTILGKFIANLPHRISSLREMLNEKNWEGLKTLAHQLKGACAGYGYERMAEIAKVMEKYLSLEPPDEDKLKSCVDELAFLHKRAELAVKSGDEDSSQSV